MNPFETVVDKDGDEIGRVISVNALDQIRQWAEAYPETVFLPIADDDWRRAEDVLKSAGLSLTRISAANMRHVITTVAEILRIDWGRDDTGK